MFWILLPVLLASFAYWFMVRPYSYWTQRGVKQGFQVPLLGDMWGLVIRKHSMSDCIQYIYSKFPEERFSGMYQFMKPILIVKDLDLIRQITVKDFDHFVDHIPIMPEGREPLWSSNVLSLKGEKWKHMRATLSPAFTSSKMKAMYELMNQCAEQLTNHFLKKEESLIEMDIKDTFTRFTNDVIATCAFGAQCDSLEQRENEFFTMGREATTFNTFWRRINLLILFSSPKISKILGLRFFAKSVGAFFTSLVEASVKMREETKLIRLDMIHLLMEARKGKLSYDEQQTAAKETGFATVEESSIGIPTKVSQKEITLEEMTAQAMIFFLAGFDGVATIMCLASYELAVNRDIQERLLKEVDETILNCKEKLTYDALNKMKYLDMFVSEILRKWNPGVNLDRICVKPYTIESQNPSEPTVHLQKGDCIWIPAWGIHHDPQYYPNPYTFDPERFSDENKGNIKPYTYMPFGVGPRNCIGSRFALLEIKTILVNILSKFEIVVTDKTQVPLKLYKGSFVFAIEKGLKLGLMKRNK